MRVTLVRNRDLPSRFGAARYGAELDRLREQLVWYTFDEGIPDEPQDTQRGLDDPMARRRIVPRSFEDRATLIAILRGFVEELFGGVAADHGKQTCCEKTPFNVLAASFLWELFPEATVVHAMRHPVAAVASHRRQTWVPNEPWQIVAWLAPVYARWFRGRDALDIQHARLAATSRRPGRGLAAPASAALRDARA